MFFCLCAEGEHVAEAALVDVEREGAAQFVDIAVQGVAVARVVALPHCHHEVRGINGLADVGGKMFQNAFLHLLQTIMVFVQCLFCIDKAQIIRRINAPR